MIARIGDRLDERAPDINIARHSMSGTVAEFDFRHNWRAMGSGSMLTAAHQEASSP